MNMIAETVSRNGKNQNKHFINRCNLEATPRFGQTERWSHVRRAPGKDGVTNSSGATRKRSQLKYVNKNR